MQQKALIVTPISLFEILNGKTVERGNCACAIVALPADRPKYTLVCYNDSRETLCVGSLSSSNEHSIQFELQTSMYASFRDNTGKRWGCMFLKSSQLDSFLAVLGIAVYALAGQPAHSTVINDFAPPAGEVRVGLQHRVKVRYSAFAIRRGNVLQLGELLETNGDRPYNFQPVQSAMALHREAKGFESSVLGMLEDSWRAVVVPATLPRSFGVGHLYGGDNVVFVLQVVRILHIDNELTESEKVPLVFACDDNIGALVPTTSQTTDGNGTKIVVLHSEQMDTATTRVADNTVEGSGVPAEHMSLVQKLGVQVNRATVDARDIRDLAMSVAGEWKQSVNKPRPSVLTNAAIEQSVKQLIMENERITEDIAHRDELINSLDQRNRELQKRVDTAAMVAHQLLDEKNDSIRKSSDLKLEKERIIMKLQEQINQAAQERDDTQRHLQTVKKLLAVSDEELRQMRGKADLQNIQAESIISKLDATQDALAEERSRRKALEAKVLVLQEKISNAEAELHLKTAQLEEICRMADIERSHNAQIMEDERQRRGFEAQQLRSEIVTELQARDAKYQADRARVVEDSFKRGQAEGREIGKREARIYVQTQLEELQLDVQTALTELDASKTELRRVTEAGMAQNRTLGAAVAELKTQMYEKTRERVISELQLSDLRAKMHCVSDSVMAAFTSVVRRLRWPAKGEDLLQLLNALKKRQPLDLSFEERNQAAEEAESMKRRIGWIECELLSLYRDRCDAAYRAWAESVFAEKKVVDEAVQRLRLERDGVAFYELDVTETLERLEIVKQMEKFFSDISCFCEEQMMQRRSLFNEAEQVWSKAMNEYVAFLDTLSACRLKELKARLELSEECIALHVAFLAEGAGAFDALLKEVSTALAEAWQGGLIEAEESDRAAIDADQFAEYSGILFDCDNSLAKILAAVTAGGLATGARSGCGILEVKGRAVREQVDNNISQPQMPQFTPLESAEKGDVDNKDGFTTYICSLEDAGEEGEVGVTEKTTPVTLDFQAEGGGGAILPAVAASSDNNFTEPLQQSLPAVNVVFSETQTAVGPEDIRSFGDDGEKTVVPKPSLGEARAMKHLSLPKPRLFDSSDSDQ